eukprot:UN07796
MASGKRGRKQRVELEERQYCHSCRLELPSNLFSLKQIKYREKQRCRICTNLMNHEYIKAFERFEELKKFRPKLPKRLVRSSWKHARTCMDRFVEREYDIAEDIFGTFKAIR